MIIFAPEIIRSAMDKAYIGISGATHINMATEAKFLVECLKYTLEPVTTRVCLFLSILSTIPLIYSFSNLLATIIDVATILYVKRNGVTISEIKELRRSRYRRNSKTSEEDDNLLVFPVLLLKDGFRPSFFIAESNC